MANSVFFIGFYYTQNFWISKIFSFSYTQNKENNVYSGRAAENFYDSYCFLLDFTSFLTIFVEILSLFSFLFQKFSDGGKL